MVLTLQLITCGEGCQQLLLLLLDGWLTPGPPLTPAAACVCGGGAGVWGLLYVCCKQWCTGWRLACFS